MPDFETLDGDSVGEQVSRVDQPSEARLLQVARAAGIAQIRTSLPGIVVSYDSNAKTAVVQPAVSDGSGEFPPLEDVPVKFPTFGLYRMIGDLLPGDECTLIFYELDPTNFRTLGIPQEVNVQRKHGLYAVCVPGDESDLKLSLLTSTPGALSIGLKTGLVDVVITPAGIQLGSAAAVLPVANGLVNDANWAALAVYLAATVGVLTGTPPPPPVPTSSVRVFTDG